jgi:hypothetical protein
MASYIPVSDFEMSLTFSNSERVLKEPSEDRPSLITYSKQSKRWDRTDLIVLSRSLPAFRQTVITVKNGDLLLEASIIYLIALGGSSS